MSIQWGLLFKSAWPIFWITTIYSYGICSVIGTITGYKTKNNRQKIDEAVDKFIISPFYIATFFSLFSVLFFAHAHYAKTFITSWSFVYVLTIGLIVFIGHLLVEILESTIFRKDPLRILSDKEAIQLSGIYLLLIILTSVIVVVSK